MSEYGVSVCISTNASKINKTRIELKSLYQTMGKSTIPSEIILCGDIEPFQDEQVTLVPRKELAHDGMLAALRNEAAAYAKYSMLLFVDDDFIFPPNWVHRLDEYTQSNKQWEVLTNRVLLPCGGRFWDRSLIKPHKLLSYDHDPMDPNLYITGGFWLIQRDLFDEEPWDGSLKINATKHGAPYNEDVDLSIRMHNRGVPLLIDKVNYVWHWDEKYTQRNDVVVLRKDYSDVAKYNPSKQFQKELRHLIS